MRGLKNYGHKKNHAAIFWLSVVLLFSIILVYADSNQKPEYFTLGQNLPEKTSTLGVALSESKKEEIAKTVKPMEINLLRCDSGKHEIMDLETYIIGVLSGEVPPSFEKSALEAQAVVARTYTLSVLNNGGELCDFYGHCQAYCDAETLKQRWGSEFEKNYQRYFLAVQETAGLIVTYDNKLAKTFFHSTCGGKTASSQEVWGENLAYLQSVDCSWDKDAPRYQERIKVKISELPNRLGIENVAVSSGNIIPSLISVTHSGRVETVSFGGEKIKATDFRKKLQLNSTNFSFAPEDGNLLIDTHGYGHGVGLCQYGANGMAKEGYNYEDIIKHYYQGVDIVPMSKLNT
ncbi:MAG: stage II sporulation protein D [Clostridiales bacterium]